MFTRLILAAFLLLVPAMPAWAGFAAGQAAMLRGDYEAAYREWGPLAQAGDPRAQFHLGVLYERGWGVPQDFREAARWYLSAADQNHPKPNSIWGISTRWDAVFQSNMPR